MCIFQVFFRPFQIRLIAVLLGISMLVFSSTEVCAQRRALSDQLPANRWSLDVKFGVGRPFAGGEISEKENTTEGENSTSPKYHYFSKSSYSIGARYMISRDFGLRTNYSHHYFSTAEAVVPSIRTHTLGLEGIYSFSKFFPEGRISNPRKWNVLVFIGGGYSLGKLNNYKKNTDQIISGVIGGTVQYRLSNSIALSFEPVTFQFNSFQNNPFKSTISVGNKFERLFKPEIFWYPSMGVHVYFGKWRQHVDWR